MNDYYAYAYYCPDRHIARYVGMGRGRRCYNFWIRRADIKEWLDALREAGKEPVVRLLEDRLTREEAYAREMAYIAMYGRECDGGTLLNKAIGGPGSNGWRHTEETKAKQVAKLSGRKLSPGHAAKVAENNRKFGASLRGKSQPPELIEKRAAALRGRVFTAEHRAALSAAKKGRPALNRGRPMSAEQKAKISATKRAKREVLDRV